MADSNVFSRTPFKSGGSKVMTVTGIPGISGDDRVYLKEVTIDNEVNAVVLVRYDELSEHELEQIDNLNIDSTTQY